MPTIKIYSTTTWPYCKNAKRFLDEKGFKYQDLDVGTDKVARKEMLDRSKQLGVPVIDIDGELIIGFNQPKIKEKLGIKD